MQALFRAALLFGALFATSCAHSGDGSPSSVRDTENANAPTELRIEGTRTLLGTDVERPRFSWLPAGAGAPTGYRVQVARSEGDLANGVTVWDSGQVSGSMNNQVQYAGPRLESRTGYVWRVQTINGGTSSSWSAPARWEMGLLHQGDWSADWISGSNEVEHVWSDSVTNWDFTLTGDNLSFLFRARPVGKTYGEAYVWMLSAPSDSSATLTALARRYDASVASLVVDTRLASIELPNFERDARHRLSIEARGDLIVTRLDGVEISRLRDASHAAGTVGVSTTQADGAVIHRIGVQPRGGAAFVEAFANNDMALSGGTIGPDGLIVGANATEKDLVFPIATPAPLLRRRFSVARDIAGARLYVATGGFPRVEINGQQINEAIGDGFTAYDRRVLYRTFDVTSQLQRGENVIGIELGRGWYALSEPNEWYWHAAPWTQPAPAVRLQLELNFTDGSREIVASDEDWRWSRGPTLHDSIYAGERYDSRRAPAGWSSSAYDDTAWAPVQTVRGPAGQLDAAEQEPIAVTETLRPVALTQPQPGVWVFDFGRIFAGRPRLRVQGPAGQTVSLVQHEKLRDDGTVIALSSHVDTQLQTDRYILSGGRVEEWAPSFRYGGFRYVEVRGFPGTPTLDSVTGEVMHSDVATLGSFESSNPLLNQIQAAAQRTILNNMHGFQTDTPTFEKNGWTGDAQASALAAALNFDVARVWTKWMADFRDAQAPNGEIPEIVPSTPSYGYENTPGWSMLRGPIPTWDAAALILPDDLYQLTADTRLLADMYETQRRLVDYTATYFTPDTFFYANPNNFYLAEYGVPPGPMSRTPGASPRDAVLGAYFYHMVDILARNAVLLGKADDAARYRTLADRVRTAYNEHYWDGERLVYRTPASGVEPPYIQYQNILPLAFGLAPREHADAIARSINDDIVAHDYHLSSTGVFSGRYVLTLLTDYGYVDTAYRVATQTTEPSWGYWLANDINTMLEGWSLTSRSYDHHYWGSISAWFYQGLAGIRSAAPGYERIEIRPAAPAGLDHAEAHLDTVRGRIESSWRRQGDELAIDVVIPLGSSAEVWCPSSTTRARASQQAVRLSREGGDVAFAVGSGAHHVQCR